MKGKWNKIGGITVFISPHTLLFSLPIFTFLFIQITQLCSCGFDLLYTALLQAASLHCKPFKVCIQYISVLSIYKCSLLFPHVLLRSLWIFFYLQFLVYFNGSGSGAAELVRSLLFASGVVWRFTQSHCLLSVGFWDLSYLHNICSVSLKMAVCVSDSTVASSCQILSVSFSHSLIQRFWCGLWCVNQKWQVMGICCTESQTVLHSTLV